MQGRLLTLALLFGACTGPGVSSPSVTAASGTAVPSTTSTTSVDTPDVPIGYAIHGSEARGFLVALPESFVEADLTPGSVADNVDGIAPDSASAIRALVADQGAAVLMVAIDSDDAADQFRTSVNILTMDRLGVEPGDIVDQLTESYAARGGSVIESRVVAVGPSQWVVLTGQRLAVDGEGGVVNQTVYSIFALAPDVIVNLTLSTDAPAEYRNVFEMIVGTFQLGIVPGLGA